VKKKALRRWQQHVVRVRLRRFLWDSFSSEYVHYKPWRARNQLGAYLMRDPGHWIHQYVTRPARARSNARLRAIERGRDPDGIADWPDYRRPHIYYW
jgi:hypothetical protein